MSLAAGLLIMAGMFLPLPWPMEQRYYAMFLLATPVQFWAGWQFYKGAWQAARHLTTNMNTLIAVGTSVAYLYSVFVTFFPDAVQHGRARARSLLRHLHPHHRPHPDGPLLRGPRQGADQRGDQEADGPGPTHGPRHREATRKSTCHIEQVQAGRPAARAPRRQSARGRRGASTGAPAWTSRC